MTDLVMKYSQRICRGFDECGSEDGSGGESIDFRS